MSNNINLNHHITIQLTDRGIDQYVSAWNINGMPAVHHKTRKQVIEMLGKDNSLCMQLWQFIDLFGGLGMSLGEYVSTEIIYHGE